MDNCAGRLHHLAWGWQVSAYCQCRYCRVYELVVVAAGSGVFLACVADNLIVALAGMVVFPAFKWMLWKRGL